MALTPADERNLIFPLFSGLQTAEGWDAFLKRLLPRTGASRICLLQRPKGSAAMHPFQREAWAGQVPPERPLDIAALEQCGLMPLASLRPERVYALEEMRSAADPDLARRQKEAMAREQVAHARFIRFEPGTDASAWLILVHDRKDFTAADSALLTSVTPYVALAIATLTQIMTLQLRAAVAEEALGLLGVGQAVLDRQGRAIVADPLFAAELGLQPESRQWQRPGTGEALARGSAGMAGKPAGARALVRIEGREPRDVLLRPALRTGDAVPRVAAATALVRRRPADHDASAAALLAQRHGLSTREAALAVALARGQSLAEAGNALRLTRETARNYSKRIYAKTGVRGQADLVRMILSDLAPFA